MAMNSFQPFGLRAQEVSSSIAWQRKPVALFLQREWMNGGGGHISLRLFLPFPFRSFPCVGDVSAHGICCQMWGWTWALNIRPDTQFIWSITNYIFHTLYVYGFEFPQYFHLGPCQDKSKMFTHTQCSWSIYNICICIKWYSHCIFWAWTHQGISMIKKCTSKTS